MPSARERPARPSAAACRAAAWKVYEDGLLALGGVVNWARELAESFPEQQNEQEGSLRTVHNGDIGDICEDTALNVAPRLGA